MNENQHPKYSEAFDELQAIVSEIEKGEISVDELSDKVKRASKLIAVCKNKLANTEEDVNQILMELDEANDHPKEDANH